MEPSKVNKTSEISAYTRICTKFIEVCEEEGMDVTAAWQRIGNFLNLPFPTSSASSPQQVSEVKEISLTKKQAEEARKNARVEKAKRLNLSFKEVNLTSEEAKEAKAAYRRKLQSDASNNNSRPKTVTSPSKPSVTTPPTGGVKTSKEEVDDNSRQSPPKKESQKQSVGVQLDKTGSRATAKTKIDNCRRSALRGLPTAIENAQLLHLVAYFNHIVKLTRQWAEYQRVYQDSGMLNPLRGLPLLSSCPLAAIALEGAVTAAALRQQADSPGTYILQSDGGASYWDRDRPSSTCPDALLVQIPQEVIREMEGVN
jgi:hypothetical protein